ncbi:DUF1906 domain-containing protein [Paenibacillus ginsengarvi]|uniref:DUF1906 domain-containing protein n=1 Tax=Paenibacillus ginsengarvi TaxID=400777 RepID=A0A3B0CLY2_9BACL|nr:DUF1906 domain-containing protein [Paenibacillus ginsengarvi]RKN85377.1 DUF1906 domain-containing protein [Paenibacillus ginsengarvi]
MTKGFDCATPLTAEIVKAFRNDGYEFVCRYLVPTGWKSLTPEEAELISTGGLNIVSVFETTADRALGGRAAGLADGLLAANTAKQVGQPEGSAIYFAVDFDATNAQMPAVIEYIRAASEATPAFLTGVYGSYAVIEAVKAASACSRFWQTYAWSYGKVSDAIQIFQYENDITVNGIVIDRDESYGNEGWWSTAQPDEGDETMRLEQWQWKMLGDSLDGLYHKGLISDYTWAEKAYKGVMTASELAWLNTVMLARENGIEV